MCTGRSSHNINSRKRFRPFISVYGEARENIREENAHDINNRKRFRPFINVYAVRGRLGKKVHGKENAHNIS